MGKARSNESSDSKPDLDRDPVTATGWVGLGNTLRSSDPDRALAAFRRAVLMDPKYLVAWLSIAELCLAGGEKRYAEDAVKEAVALLPVGAEETERLCVLLLFLGREVDAERFGKRLLALNPEDKRSWSKLRSDLRARTMYRTPVPAPATGASVDGVLEQAQAARRPDVSAEIQTQSSVTKQQASSRQSAIEGTMPSQDMTTGRAAPPAGQAAKPPAPILYPARPQAAAARDQKTAAAEAPSGQPAGTEASFRRLMEANPDSLQAAKGLAKSLHAQGKLVETIQMAEKGLALKADDPELLYLIGSSALGTRNFSRARQALQRCTAVAPRYIAAWIDLGYCHICEGHANDAASALLFAIRIDPNNARALVYFVRALMMQGQDERAASVLMKVLETEKTSSVALEEAAELFEALGQNAAAQKARTRAAGLRSQTP